MAQSAVRTKRPPAWPKDALRATFGVIWLIDAILKWLPGFRSGYSDEITSAAKGQPGGCTGGSASGRVPLTRISGPTSWR